MNSRLISTSGKKTQQQEEHVGVAFYLKREMAALVDQAYSDATPEMRALLKNFRIHLTEKASNTLGDCRFWKDNQVSDILLYGVVEQNPTALIVILIHQVTHHIDYIMRGTTAHDSDFYGIHKQLLETSLNMGILSKKNFDMLVNADSIHAKAANLINSYEEQPIAYKQETYQIGVYNVFSKREELKARGYWWNSLEKSWEKEVPATDYEKEMEFLATLDIDKADVYAKKYDGIQIRRKQIIRASNVSYESIDTLKRLGFYSQKKGSKSYWEKQFDGELPKEEVAELMTLQGVKYRIM